MRHKSVAMRWGAFAVALMFSLGLAAKETRSELPEMRAAELPPAAQHTLALIKQGGPFPYSKDGVVFGNYEKRLPRQKRGYYREYTVATPGAHSRGARRIISGGEPPAEYFYTDDHYATFRRIQE